MSTSTDRTGLLVPLSGEGRRGANLGPATTRSVRAHEHQGQNVGLPHIQRQDQDDSADTPMAGVEISLCLELPRVTDSNMAMPQVARAVLSAIGTPARMVQDLAETARVAAQYMVLHITAPSYQRLHTARPSSDPSSTPPTDLCRGGLPAGSMGPKAEAAVLTRRTDRRPGRDRCPRRAVRDPARQVGHARPA